MAQPFAELSSSRYEQVLALGQAMLQASVNQNTRLMWRYYAELQQLCEAEDAAGNQHPFFYQALANFTTDHRIALSFYAKALIYAEYLNLPDYIASIQRDMAEYYQDLGEWQLASHMAFKAQQTASQLDDLNLRREISQLQLQLSQR